jgi:hypothetical protein
MACHYSLNNNINLTSFACYKIRKFRRLGNCGLACDVLLDQEDDSLKGVGALRHEDTLLTYLPLSHAIIPTAPSVPRPT